MTATGYAFDVPRAIAPTALTVAARDASACRCHNAVLVTDALRVSGVVVGPPPALGGVMTRERL